MLGHFPLGGAPLGGSVNTGISGTLSATEANDALAATGTIALKAALSGTESNDAAAVTAALAIRATLSAAQADDTLSAAGALAIRADANTTLAGAAAAATGAAAIKANASIIEQEDEVAASGETGIAPAPIIIATRHGADDRKEFERRQKEWQEDLRRIVDRAWKVANGEIDPVTLEPMPPADLASLAGALELVHKARDQAALDEFMADEARLQEEEAVALLLLAA
jgi:hypothetical protein